MKTIFAFACAAALFLGSSAASAQVDCTRVPDSMRAKCEDVNRMNRTCGALSGDARMKCERDVMNVPVKEDCRRLPEQARALCEAHNRAAERAERCNGKMGADFEACRRENGIKEPLQR